MPQLCEQHATSSPEPTVPNGRVRRRTRRLELHQRPRQQLPAVQRLTAMGRLRPTATGPQQLHSRQRTWQWPRPSRQQTGPTWASSQVLSWLLRPALLLLASSACRQRCGWHRGWAASQHCEADLTGGHRPLPPVAPQRTSSQCRMAACLLHRRACCVRVFLTSAQLPPCVCLPSSNACTERLLCGLQGGMTWWRCSPTRGAARIRGTTWPG